MRAGRTAQVQIIVDGIDSITAGMVLDYSAKIAEEFSQRVESTLQRRLSHTIDTTDQPLSEDEVNEWLAIFKTRG